MNVTLKINYHKAFLLGILVSIFFPFVVASFGERNIRVGDISTLLLMPFFFLISRDFIDKCSKHKLALIAFCIYLLLHITHMFYLWGTVSLLIPAALLIKDTLLVCIFVVCAYSFPRVDFVSLVSRFSVFYTFIALIYVFYQFLFVGFLGHYTYSVPFLEGSSIGSGLLLLVNFTLLLSCYALKNNFYLLFFSIVNLLLLIGTASRTSILAAFILLIPPAILGIKVFSNKLFRSYSANKILLIISSFLLGLVFAIFVALQDFIYGSFSIATRFSNLALLSRFDKATINVSKFSSDLGVFIFGNGRGYLEATGQSFYLDSQFARSYLESGFFMAFVIFSLFFYFLCCPLPSISASIDSQVAKVHHPNLLNALLLGFVFAIFALSYSYDIFHLSVLSFPLVFAFAFMYSCSSFVRKH